MQILLVIILVVVGVALLVVELFLIPGIGAAGIAGLLSAAAGVAYAYWKISASAGHIALGAALLLCAVAIYVFLKTRTLDKMALKKNIDDKVDLLSDLDIQKGTQCMTVSRLAPIGKVRIHDRDVEAKSLEDFIDQDVLVEVVSVEGNKVNVKPVK